MPAGDAPILEPGRSLVALVRGPLVLSACKPAAGGTGIVLRLLNPTGAPVDGVIRLGVAIDAARAVRLDETPVDAALAPDGDELVRLDGDELHVRVAPHHLASVLLEP